MLSAADAAVSIRRGGGAPYRGGAELRAQRSRDGRSSLARSDNISSCRGLLEKARLDVETSEAALASAKAQLDVRRSERASVAARLIDPSSEFLRATAGTCCIQLRAPGERASCSRSFRIARPSSRRARRWSRLAIRSILRWSPICSRPTPCTFKVGAPVRIDGWGGAPRAGPRHARRSCGLSQGLGARHRGAAGARYRSTLVDPPRSLVAPWP